MDRHLSSHLSSSCVLNGSSGFFCLCLQRKEELSGKSKNNSLACCRLQEFAMSSKVNIIVNKYNRLAIMLAKRVLRN
jgi:hypothetical protein